MGLEGIDIDSWGKKPPEKKPPQPPKEPRQRPQEGSQRQVKPKKEPGAELGRTRVKPQQVLPLEEVPIDALRGLYYLLVGTADKKQSKVELKRNLQALLSTPAACKKLVQAIANVVDIELIL
jgi:hypothetical protein